MREMVAALFPEDAAEVRFAQVYAAGDLIQRQLLVIIVFEDVYKRQDIACYSGKAHKPYTTGLWAFFAAVFLRQGEAAAKD